MALLYDQSRPVKILYGVAGSGKNLLSLYYALQQVQEGRYSTVHICRNAVSVGRDIGHLPGSIDEKLGPYHANVRDIMPLLGKFHIEPGEMEILSLSHVRGRTLNNIVILDECIPYDQYITTEYGKIKMGVLFQKYLAGSPMPLVKTYDEHTGQFTFGAVSAMVHKGQKECLKIVTNNRTVQATDNHPFLTSRGWVPAGELQVGDMIVQSDPGHSRTNKALTDVGFDFVLGSYLGDGSVCKQGPSRARLAITHGLLQSDYIHWKAEKLGTPVVALRNSGYQPDVDKLRTCTTVVADGLFNQIGGDKGKQLELQAIDRINARSLAIWFMDDGSGNGSNSASLHTEGFPHDLVEALAAKLLAMGVDCVASDTERNGFRYKYIRIRQAGYRALSDMIAQYVHPSMAYKLHADYRHEAGRYVWPEVYHANHGLSVVQSITSAGTHHVFDMEVPGTNTFCLTSASMGQRRGDLVVHNCQNLTVHEIKTLVSRIGAKGELIILGDPEQCDIPGLRNRNGLLHVIDRIGSNPLVGVVKMSICERGPVAKLAGHL